MTKLLVATGRSLADVDLSNVEIVDLSSEGGNCQDLADFPLNLESAIGGYFDLTTPIICGGWTGV